MPFQQQSHLRFGKRREVFHLLTKQPAHARTRLQVTVEDIDDGGFPCAVLSQQAQYLSLLHVETEIFVNQAVSVIMRNIFTFYYFTHCSTIND